MTSSSASPTEVEGNPVAKMTQNAWEIKSNSVGQFKANSDLFANITSYHCSSAMEEMLYFHGRADSVLAITCILALPISRSLR